MAYANPDALVTTDWLKENLSDPNVRVIEVDEDATVYDKDHIPGAIAWTVVGLWYLYRCIVGWLRFNDGRAAP